MLKEYCWIFLTINFFRNTKSYYLHRHRLKCKHHKFLWESKDYIIPNAYLLTLYIYSGDVNWWKICQISQACCWKLCICISKTGMSVVNTGEKHLFFCLALFLFPLNFVRFLSGFVISLCNVNSNQTCFSFPNFLVVAG